MKVLVQAKSHDAPLSSSGTAVAAFAALQKALTDTTPFENPEHGAPTSLMVNASGLAVRAVHQQLRKGIWRPIIFFSKKLSPSENKIALSGEIFRLVTSQ